MAKLPPVIDHLLKWDGEIPAHRIEKRWEYADSGSNILLKDSDFPPNLEESTDWAPKFPVFSLQIFTPYAGPPLVSLHEFKQQWTYSGTVSAQLAQMINQDIDGVDVYKTPDFRTKDFSFALTLPDGFVYATLSGGYTHGILHFSWVKPPAPEEFHRQHRLVLR